MWLSCGVLSDVEDELRADIERLRAQLQRERRAREHRLSVHRLAAATGGQVTRHGVAEVIAGGTSDIFEAGWVMVAYVGDDEIVHFVHGPGVPDVVRSDWQTAPINAEVPICESLRSGTRIELPTTAHFAPWPLLEEWADRARLSSLTVEPISGDERPLAVVALGWSTQREMDDQERALLAELADIAAPAFRRAITTETDHDIATTLQSWLLPARLPEFEHLTVSTIYEAGKDALKVGGDWYDLVEVDEGRAAIVVGDVVGHDIRAAAEMGQVRHVLSSNLARSGDAIESLALTDRYFCVRGTGTMATALVMVFDAHGRTLEIASAGHLPPVVVEPGTAARTLDCGLGPPIGSGLGGYETVERPFPIGAVLIGVTDGVVEERDRPIDVSMADFCTAVDETLTRSAPHHVMAALTALVTERAVDPEQRDDAAAVILQSR